MEFIITFGSVTPCLAAENSQKGDLDEVIAQIKETYPDAVIKVTEDGIINVVASATPTALTKASSEYAPNGGSYRRFMPPWYVPSEGMVPYSMIYLPAEQTVALQNARNIQALFEDIISLANDGLSHTAIAQLVLKKFGYALSPVGIAFIIGIRIYSVINWIDSALLSMAVNNSPSGRILITRTTTQGWPTNMYFAWSGDYVTCSPYEDYNPVFYRGIYDF